MLEQIESIESYAVNEHSLVKYSQLSKEKRQATSAVIWRGVSPVNGDNIMAVVSGLVKPSDNAKTGVMAQVSILLADMHPVEGYKSGADQAICGNCPLRLDQSQNGKRICYVNVGFGESSKFRAMMANKYIDLTPAEVGAILKERQLGIRFGSYGDPAMLPFEIVDTIITIAGTKYTSYTHQWTESFFDNRHLKYSMASLDHVNTVDALQEQHPEARYYRLADSYENLAQNEVKCPSDKDLITCAKCGLCSGTNLKAKSVVIIEE
tara:strand:+ start:3372 stop:4166 length:795 start_codon:yes stop_codon:yes gene_type:complete